MAVTILLAAGTRRPEGVAFDLVLLAHVVTAFIGFGSIVVTGVTAGLLRGGLDRFTIGRTGSGAGTAQRYFRPGTNWVGRTVYAVPVLGVALVAMGKGAFTFADAWMQVGVAFWATAVVFAEGMLWPTERRVQVLLSEAGGPCDAASDPDTDGSGPATELRRCCTRLVLLAGCLGLLFLVTAFLMVAQP